MDAIAASLALELVQKLRQTPPNQRLLVGLAGSPAAGKSSFAHRLLTNIREHEPTVALLVGLDGWHLTRAALDLMPDPALAHERRGAHWTFDADGYVAFITALRAPLQPDMNPIMAPTFSHSIKDPAFDAIRVEEHHRLVIVEGLYPFLSIEPWVEAAKLLDERWFIRVDEEEAANRLTKRHVETGICPDAEEARKRAEGNDLPNVFLVENMLADHHSIGDPLLARELDS
ncbi:PRK domain-containing protein [Mycena chlorophos]|uniref:PRK domain-containing protein n=1 Tax=Mycena chlorophos TaxID=658473 RepID=A0A8H6T6K2_MYCCL|nr:PRK domain-containing protein [Mycena chlorophos]